jgi:2-polyprenyl-3-methyl-5-hydroxy-6-metoxy-1,4-benzoquinol methylase
MAANKHTYEYEIDLTSDVAPARVISMVTPGSRVLEIGAGPGSITRHLVKTLGCSVVALEVDPSAIEILKQYVPKVYAADLNDSKWSDRVRSEDGEFDFVIAADVLEHVYDPWSVLLGMQSLLKPGGAVILSLPHVGHASVAACLVDEDFEYWPWGLLDRTHIRFFGVKNIQSLINDSGLSIEKAEFVVRTPMMTEFATRWQRLPSDIQNALQRNRFSHVLQVVTLSRKSLPGENGLELMDLNPQPPSRDAIEHWTRVMARQVNARKTDTRTTLLSTPLSTHDATLIGGFGRFLKKMRKRLR